MSDPIASFDKWCDEFPDYLIPNDPNLMGNLNYFDQVIGYYRANFTLCEPYQQFTNKFMSKTIRNALLKMVNFPTLDPQIFQKVNLIFAKLIDLSAQLIIKNVFFYKAYSVIPDYVYDTKTNYMISNINGYDELQKTVKDYPYLELVEWIQKSPIIDWDIFHYLVNYLFFIKKYTTPENSLSIFIPSFLKLFSSTTSPPKNADSYLFAMDMVHLLVISSQTSFKQSIYQKTIYLMIILIMNFNNLSLIIDLITVISNIQKEKDVEQMVIEVLNETNFYEAICNPSIPIDILKEGPFHKLKMDEDIIIKILNCSSIQEYKDKRFSDIFKICLLLFRSLDQSKKITFFQKFLKVDGNDSYRIQLLFLFDFLEDKDSIPTPLIDDIIDYFYKSGPSFEMLLRHDIMNSKNAYRIIIFLCNHSHEESSIKNLISFAKNNLKFFSLLKEDECRQVLLKNDYYSFDFYFQLLNLGGHKLMVEDLKAVWNQILAHDDRIPLFLKYFLKNFSFLFSPDALSVFMTSLMSLDYSKISQNMINLLIDFIYVQEKAKEGKTIDKSMRIQNFNQFGMNELFKCYLNTKNSSTLTYVKTQLLNIWNNCDCMVTGERNEVLSEIMIKNSSNENQYVRCFNFLNDFIRTDGNYRILEDIGFSHLKKQKKLLQNKTIKLTIILTKEKKQQSNQVETDSEILEGTMLFLPSDLCIRIKDRAQVKFKCKSISSAYCYGRKLNDNSTLEMEKIIDGSVIQLEYTSINNALNNYQQLQIYMPRMLMNCVPIYQKALDLLHTEKLTKELALSILDFIYYLPISFQLMSLLDTNDAISKAINDSLNPYERELFLHVLYKSIDDEKVKSMLISNQFYMNLIDIFNDKELNKAGYKRALSILIKIWPENGKESEEFINEKLHNFINKIILLMINKEARSRKFIDICADLILKINSCADSYKRTINEEIVKNIMDIVKNVQFRIFGKIISQLQNKDEIFDILYPYLDEFSTKEDRCPFFFDAIFSSIDNETKNLKTIFDFVLSHLYNYGTSAFSSICEFIIGRNELYSQIDVHRFFDYIEEKRLSSSNTFKLINEIYEKEPEKRNEIMSILMNYISFELPEYNISENFVIKKNPLGSGIRNLSNTCYINSALQLLFNVNLFKITLLKKDDTSMTDWQKKLQNLFAVKDFSFLPFVDPSDFVNNYKMMGEKINISEQQDTAEFLHSIIDGLPPDLSAIFRGSLTNMVTGIDYTYFSSNNEKFYFLQLDVDGCESLEASLDRLQQSEIVNDYKVQDRVENSITVKKTTIIQDLPPVLLIQLRRFVYNLKTFNKEKLNSYFSFPLSINMSNYCIGKKDKPENYILTGFILHSGKADFGHFHYIGYNKKMQNWVDYNDSITFSYQISNLEKDAFGSSSNINNDSCQSAYILVYEKVDENSKFDEIELSQISESLRNAIKSEQIKMERISSVMSDDFYNLAICSLDIKFLYNYFTRIMLHLNDIEKCKSVKNKLCSLLKGNKKGIQEVIELIENDKTGICTPIIYITNNLIIHTWIDFMIFVIKNSENGEFYCFVNTLLNCINVFKDNPDQAKLFAEVGKEVLKYPDSLIFAQSQKWQVSFLLVLATIIENAIKAENYRYVDIDLFLDDLILMAPIIGKDEKKLLNSLGAFMKYFKPKTQKLYNDLIYSLSCL